MSFTLSSTKIRTLQLFFALTLIASSVFAFLPAITTASLTNLVQNGDFEIASATPNLAQGWTLGGYGTNSASTTYPVAGVASSSAANITISSYTDGDSKLVMTPVVVTAGHAYTYSDAYQSGTTTQLVVEYTSTTNVVTFGNFTTVPASASSTWGAATVGFIPPAGTASVRVYHSIYSVGSLSLDNVVVNDITVSQDPNNLIPNASFDNFVPAVPTTPLSWTTGSYGSASTTFTYPVVGRTNNAVKVSNTAYTSGDAKWVMSPASVVAGRTYTYTDYYTSNATTQLSVEYTNASSTVSYANFQSVAASSNLSTWATTTTTFTVPAGVVSVRIYHSLMSVGELTLDDTSLTDTTPVPTLSISPTVIQNGAVNVPYTQTLTAVTTASGPFSWSIDSGSLPAGFTLATSTGVTTTITGSTTATSTNTFVVKVTNGTYSATKQYTITIFPTLVTTATVKVVTNVINDNGETNIPSDFNITVTGASSTPSLSVGNAVGTNVSVSANTTYKVSTNSGLFYTVAYSPDCTGVLAGGDSTTCTVTLDDLPPSTVGQLSPNLIQNPSLDTANPGNTNQPQYWTPSSFGTNSISFSYVAASSTNDEISPAGMVGRIDVASYTSGDAKWIFNNVTVIPGHNYTYRDIYLSNVPTQLILVSTHTDNTLTYSSFTTIAASPASTTWEQASMSFTVPDGVTSVTVYHTISSAGSLSIDNASLTEVPLPISFDQGFVSLTFDDGLLSQYQNALPILDAAHVKGSFYIITHTAGMAIANPGLEVADAASSTVPKGWLTSGSSKATFTYPVVGQTGKGVEVSSATSSSNAAWYFNPVSVMDDANYAYSDSYRSNTTSDILIQMTDASGTLLYVNSAGNPVTNKVAALSLASTSNAWVTLAPFKFYVPLNIKSVTVLHRLTGTGTLDTDNVTLGDFSDYMTPAQILQMQADGQEIGGHTQTHADLAALSAADQTTQLSQGRQDLLDYGVSPASTMAFPYGSYNTATLQIANQAGYIATRTVLPGFNGRNSNIYTLLGQSVNTNTTLAQVETWVDQAKANKQWLILIFHPIKTDLTGEAYGATPQMLTDIVNYINASNVPVRTMAGGAVLMGAPKLNVSVVVNNTHGATSTPADFTVAITGASASPSSFSGSASSTLVSIQPQQQYSVGIQSVPSYYTVATSTNCSGSQLQGVTVSCVITLSDIAVNHAPVATNSATSTQQDTATSVKLLATDVDANPLTYTIVTAPAHGTLAGTTSVETYTPAAGFTGSDTFTFKANDGLLDSNIATVTIAVLPNVSTPPAASSTNLILNPSFVTANGSLPLNWSQGGWGTNTATFTYPVTGTTDAKAAKVQITAYTDGDAKWVFDKVAVTPGHTYTYSDSYISNVASQLEVQFTNSSNSESYANATPVVASTPAWGTATVTFTVPANVTSVSVFHYISSVGSLTIDDASLVDQSGGTVVTPPVPPITLIPLQLPSATISTSYNQTLSANTTAVGPFTWSIASGSLPTGLSLGSSSGVSTAISGTPTATGFSSFSVRVTNGTSSTTQSYNITVGNVAATSSNLIRNPTFTEGNAADTSLPQYWSHGGWGTNTATFSYPVAGKTDATAAKVQITAFTSGDAKWVFDPVTATAGHTYTYTDSYQSGVATQLVVEYLSTSNVYSYANFTTVPASAASWATATVTFTAPAGTASVRVFHLISAVGSLTVDDASLTDSAGVVVPPPSTTNLVANPTFGAANTSNPSLPLNWSQDGWGTNTAVFSYPVLGTTDTTAANVQITAYTDGDSKWVMDPVSVTPGSSYSYSDAYLANVSSHLEVQFLDASNNETYINDTILPAASAWGTGSVVFTAPTGAVSVRVLHYLTSVGSLTIDDASIMSQ